MNPAHERSQPLFASDVSMLHAASSYIVAYDGLRDPKASHAFERICTAFCNGTNLVLPLPKGNTESEPGLANLWQAKGALTLIPNLELSDSGFEEISEPATLAFVECAEGGPSDIVRWIEFQFSATIMDQVVLFNHVDPILRASGIARELLTHARVPKLAKAVEIAQCERGFREPSVFEKLIGTRELPSVAHLAIAYALSVYLRGYAYAVALGRNGDSPIYCHHWIRSPILRSVMPFETHRGVETEPTDWFPWGGLLANLFALSNPALPRELGAVRDVLTAIRQEAGPIRDAIKDGKLSVASHKGPALQDGEETIIRVLLRAGAPLKYRDSSMRERLKRWLDGLVADQSPLWRIPVEIVTTQLEAKWLRATEQVVRAKIRRDTFWDIFEDPGVARAVRSVSHCNHT